MLKITEDNYEYYKKISNIIWIFEAKLAGIDPYIEYLPINVLSGWEKKSKSLARRGLKEGLLDQLSDISDLPGKERDDLNRQLIENDLPSVNQLTAIIKQIPFKVLKRGKIKNINEYYVIKEIISDLTYKISDTEREDLEKIIVEFEYRSKK